MALSTRQINISLRFPTAQTSATVRFIPDLAAGDGQVLLEETYTATLTASPAATTLSGSINLPVKAAGFIAYRVQFPRETGYNEHYIYVDAGSAVDLSYLLTLTEVANATISLDDLTDVIITAAASGEYLRYNGTEWADSAIQVGDLPASVMLKTTYDTDTDGVVDKAEQIVVTVRNDEATTLTPGTIVYISGANGTHVLAKRAQANSEIASANALGMVIESITSGADGKIALNGTVDGIDTDGIGEGDPVWLSAAIAGAFTSTKPTQPNHAVFVGWVARESSNNGRIVLHIQNGYEIDELHDVLITSKQNNDLLVYESATSLWKNKSFSTLGLALDANVVKLTGAQTAEGAKTLADLLTLRASVDLSKANGTLSSPTTVSSGDTLGQLTFKGYDGSAFWAGAYISTAVDGTLNATSIPTKIIFGTSNTSSPLPRMTLQKTGNLTIGTATEYSVRLVSLATTEQLRLMYDASNYFSTTVGSSGSVTFNAVGSGASFIFNDTVYASNASIGFIYEGLYVQQETSGYGLIIRPDADDFTADRYLNIRTGNASKTLTLSGDATIGGTNTGDQNVFSTVGVSGQSTLVADGTSDTLTFVAGSNITITTDASTDSITIAATSSISDGDKGDITVSSSGATWTIDSGAVTDTKLGTGINANKIADGSISNTEFQYLNGVSSAIQTQLDGKVDENASITGATKTKITYDAKGLVTAGADATTADIADSSNKRYVTDADLTKLSNLSGTNSGDQNLFSTIAVSGQSNVVADSTSDTLTLVAGSNITITTNATSDEITIAASGGGGSIDGSGAANKLAIWSDADTLTSDTNLHWDTTNDRLGVGVTSPDARVHSLSTTEPLRLAYDATSYMKFAMDGFGYLTMTSSDPTDGGLLVQGGFGIENTDYQLRITHTASVSYLDWRLSSVGVSNFQTYGSGAKFVFNAAVEVPDDAYASGWNGSTAVPTKNAVYDKIQTIGVRVTSATNSDTAPTPNADTTDIYTFTALSVAPTFGAPTGTPVNGQKLIIRIKDNGTARALSWNAAYVAGGASLPTTTVINKTMHLGFIYNTDNSLNKWMLIAKAEEA